VGYRGGFEGELSSSIEDLELFGVVRLKSCHRRNSGLAVPSIGSML